MGIGLPDIELRVGDRLPRNVQHPSHDIEHQSRSAARSTGHVGQIGRSGQRGQRIEGSEYLTGRGLQRGRDDDVDRKESVGAGDRRRHLHEVAATEIAD
jgi:hypothetical protein